MEDRKGGVERERGVGIEREGWTERNGGVKIETAQEGSGWPGPPHSGPDRESSWCGTISLGPGLLARLDPP